jgi:ADP-L-glycero-D-manno-heptose 6-epimerase
MNQPNPVLVTGSDGFIGSFLLRNVPGATADTEAEVKAILHQAANNDTLDVDESSMFASNVDYTRRLFEKHLDKGCEVFVFASSTAVYGDGPAPYVETQELRPLNPYARSKVAMEEWVFDWARRMGVRAVGLRYCNVYGPGECHKGRRASTIRHLIAQTLRGERPRLFKDGTQRRDWVHVSDVSRANSLALIDGEGVYNVGSGTSTTFTSLAGLVLDAAGVEREIEYVDMPFDPARYQSYTECDLAKVEDALGYRPLVEVGAGISTYVDWLRLRKGACNERCGDGERRTRGNFERPK